jgi:hypothetical protein
MHEENTASYYHKPKTTSPGKAKLEDPSIEKKWLLQKVISCKEASPFG